MIEQLTLPVARPTDTDTAHAAARTVAAANTELVQAIRRALIEHGPMSSWEIAYAVEDAHGDRWALDTIRTGCARAGLAKYDWDSMSPRGHRCCTYVVETETVTVDERL